MEENKKQIGYVPQINYTDDYYSELEFNDINDNDNTIEQEEGKQIVEDLLTNMNNLNSLISKLPNEVSNTIKEVYDPVLDFIEEELKDKVVESIPEEEN